MPLEWDEVELMTGSCFKQTAVYRFFDLGGQLLYVGITDDPKNRFTYHRNNAPWWNRADPAATTLRWYDSRTRAERVELEAIEAEQPEFNIVGKDGYKGGFRRAGMTADQAREVAAVVALHRKYQELFAEYRAALIGLIKDGGEAVTVPYMATRLGIPREVVRRHLSE